MTVNENLMHMIVLANASFRNRLPDSFRIPSGSLVICMLSVTCYFPKSFLPDLSARNSFRNRLPDSLRNPSYLHDVTNAILCFRNCHNLQSRAKSPDPN